MTTRTDGPDWFHTADQSDQTDQGDRAAEVDLVDRADQGDQALQVDQALRADDVGAVEEDGYDDLLDDWQPRRRTDRLTVVLAVAVVAAGTFAGGALVQKHFGTAAGPTAGSFASGALPSGGLPSGFPGGGEGFPGAQQGQAQQGQAQQGAAPAAGAAAGAATGGTSAAGSGTTNGAAAAAPPVVGTVRSVDGDRLVVENFAGKQVTVTVPETATVTAPGLAGVAAGMTVAVVGTTGGDGAVTATSVTARSAD